MYVSTYAIIEFHNNLIGHHENWHVCSMYMLFYGGLMLRNRFIPECDGWSCSRVINYFKGQDNVCCAS